jgi:NIMA (never in mitosis gene a)-related kinase
VTENGESQPEHRVLKEILLHDEEQCCSTSQEVQILSQLHHPNIIKYFDSFEAPGGDSTGRMLCLVMEYCPGGDVGGIIARRRGVLFEEEQIIIWFKQLVSALDHLHQRKILHRDVKTGNIFANADASVLKLGDFGNARVLERNSQMAKTCVGTPNYLSPEICSRRQYNSKTDIWSLGCVLYQLLTLRPPFSGRNIHHLLTQILRSHFAPIPPRYSYELRNTVSLMLRKNPDERPGADILLKKRFFTTKPLSLQNKLPGAVSQRASSAPIKRSPFSDSSISYKSHRKGLGSLSVYATPQLRRPVKSKSVQGVAQKKKEPRRKQWKSPTQTLLGALKSLSLFEGEKTSTTAVEAATFTISHKCRPLSEYSKDNDFELCNDYQSSGDSLSFECDDKTWILGIKNPHDSAYLRLERWLTSLEDTHGIELLKKSTQAY